MTKVSCAIIVDEHGKVLVTQRGIQMKMPLKWEFPGGKIEVGETAAACLIREIYEELQVQIEIVAELPVNEHRYPDFSIRLMPFVCRIINGTILLKEHAAYRWLNNNKLYDLDWAAADIPVVRNYLAFTNDNE